MKTIRMLSIICCFIMPLTIVLSAEEKAGAPKPFIAKLSDDGIQRVEVKLDSYLYDPNYIVVVVNKPVELILKNVTKITPHNFSIDHPEAGMNVNEDVKAGKEVKVSFTPTKTGNFEFYCNISGMFGNHKKKGMVGTLEVRE